MAPLTHLANSSSPASAATVGSPHLSASTSRQHPWLYLHHCQCGACLRYRPLEPPSATPASIVVARATSLGSAPLQRRMSLRATSVIHHVVHRRWLLQRSATSTTPLWKDIPEGESVLAGTFSLNRYPVVTLFDSGATHDFIGKACTKRCQLVIQHIDTAYVISTPGGKIVTKQMYTSRLSREDI
jgi:hypothetical protein